MKDHNVKESLSIVIKLIEDFKMENQICMSSFIPQYLSEIKNLKKDIEYGFLIDNKDFNQLKPLNSEHYPELDFEHKGTINLHFSHCTKENIEFIRKNNLGVHAWFSKNPLHYKDNIVTEDEVAFKKLLDLGVDVICTNYPDIALKVREEFLESEQIKIC